MEDVFPTVREAAQDAVRLEGCLALDTPAALAIPLGQDLVRELVNQTACLVLQQLADHPEYLTTQGVADYLHWPKKRIDNLCSMGRIPHNKEGGRRIFIRQEIDRWVQRLDGPTVRDALALAS